MPPRTHASAQAIARRAQGEDAGVLFVKTALKHLPQYILEPIWTALKQVRKNNNDDELCHVVSSSYHPYIIFRTSVLF